MNWKKSNWEQDLQPDSFTGMQVTIMGLGLHGGGVASAKFFAHHGASVTVTDLRDRNTLSPSIKALKELPVHFVLGEHREEDFKNADIVIKNPAVPATSAYLSMAKHIESDISIFLRFNHRPVIAVTGSKGKSTTVSAMQFCLSRDYPDTRLGGNITVSPLRFLEDPVFFARENCAHPVVLELSSWQLADLRPFGDLLSPRIALITCILPDHQDRYPDMESYVRDKEVIFQSQSTDCYTFCNADDIYGQRFSRATPGTPLLFSRSPLPGHTQGAWLTPEEGYLIHQGKTTAVLPSALRLPGEHNRLNLLLAGSAAVLHGATPHTVREELSKFPGIAHRCEFVAEKKNIRYYNDSAATIPDAVSAALKGFNAPVHLIIGGTDKNLDFSALHPLLPRPKAVYILDGSAREKVVAFLQSEGISHQGIYSDFPSLFTCLKNNTAPGDVVLLSPGAASFDLFMNEFSRGNQFKEEVKKLAAK